MGENILIDEGWYANKNHQYFLDNNLILSQELFRRLDLKTN